MNTRFWKFIDELILFYREARNRLKASTPKFHRVLGNAGLLVGFISGLATFMMEKNIISSPEWIENLTLVISFCAGMTKVITWFTFATGEKVSLPYTEKMQEKAIEKKNDAQKN